MNSDTKSYLKSLGLFLAISLGISMIIFQITKDSWFLRMISEDVSKVRISTLPSDPSHSMVKVCLAALDSEDAVLSGTDISFDLVPPSSQPWDQKTIEELVKKQKTLPKHITSRIADMILQKREKPEVEEHFMKRQKVSLW